MKIYSMTATFGKLENQTLDLREGLNVIHAPNEWGKSTWCAFLVAMLYGISTSSRTSKNFLAEKERYAPWSGKPMAGRIDLNWNGRDITIERSAKGRIPFGNFRAYETDTNVDVLELTGENCGQMLLGVEQEVFTRAGFLRLTDLPVTDAEALRRRLHALVTTGDESGASDDLEDKLSKLKNECRHNKTGRIPKAETQRDELQNKLDQLQYLKEQSALLKQRDEAQADYEKRLENHQVALTYARSLESRAHVDKASAEVEAAQETLQQLDEQCAQLPTQQSAQQELERLGQLQTQWTALEAQEKLLPEMPDQPQAPSVFAGKDPYQAVAQATADQKKYEELCKPASPICLILAVVALLGAVGLAIVNVLFALPCVVLAAVLLVLHSKGKKSRSQALQAVCATYGNDDPESWVALARNYESQMAAFQGQTEAYRTQAKDLQIRRDGLQQTQDMLTGGKPLEQCLETCQQVIRLRQAQSAAMERCQQAQLHAQTVAAMVQTAPEPQMPDDLTLSQAETERAILDARQQRQNLQQQIAKCEANMESLGDKHALEQALAQVQERLAKLEQYNGALTLALETLAQTATELQRRFAPRISARAKALFQELTGGRYDRLQLASDLSMEVAATDEVTPHGVMWRSDGTADQLYLALRLAVAEELTPQAPLVLDDAFVRFDDTRLKAAMEILKEYAQNKQVILFTCQTREQKFEG